MDEGGGFGFVTYTNDDGDGTIKVSRAPVGSRLALGVDYGDGNVDCDIYILQGAGIIAGTQIVVPRLTNAAMGGSVGIDFGELMAPPFLLTPGDRFTVMDGVLPDWPSLRFVDESGVPGLETFVQVVDTRAFNGDVIVSNASLRFTFVPEPSSLLLLMLAAAGLSLTLRRRVWRFQKPVCA